MSVNDIQATSDTQNMSVSSSTTDREILDKIRVGGSEADLAFRALYGRYGKRIYAYALKVMRSDSRASDITHDVFMKLLMAIKDGAMIDNLAAYVMRITRNLCINARRNNNMEYVEPDQVDPVDHAVETPEQRDMREHVLRAIDELPEVYREALVLQLYGGLSYAEICDVTGETLPTIRHRISRAKERLRKKLLPLFTV